MKHQTCGILAAIFKLLTPLLRVLAVLVMLLFVTGSWWPGPSGPNWGGVPVFIPGLFIGTALMVFVPYVKTALQAVSETGNWSNAPPFDMRYLALFLIPIMSLGVLFLTVEGLWEVAHAWGLIESISLAYLGVDLSKQVGKAAVAVYKIRQLK